MWARSKTTSAMEKGLSYSEMDTSMKDNLTKIKEVEKVHISTSI